MFSAMCCLKNITKMAPETIFALRIFGKMKAILTDRKGHAQSLCNDNKNGGSTLIY